jgi:glucose-6-phosphate 1-dehydrogenase
MAKVDVHDAQSVRQARAKALQAIAHLVPDEVVRGQYEGFLDTHGVQQDSNTETYFKISFTPPTGDWKDVRCTLEAGKALDVSCGEAVVTFRSQDRCHCGAFEESHTHKNTLRMQFAPEQAISLSLWGKKPGHGFTLEERQLVLLTEKSLEEYSPEAYEKVLYDCIAGDLTRFVSGAEVEAAWQFITPILDSFNSIPLHQYPPGSAGPKID